MTERSTRDILENTDSQIQDIAKMLIEMQPDLEKVRTFLVRLEPLMEAAEVMLDTPAVRLRVKIARRGRGRTDQ